MNRILVIDDDTELCELLTDYLGGEGFAVDTVHQGDRGAELALAGEYLLIVLDVMLPGLNGFDVLRRIRQQSAVPVLMLTARGDDVDRIVGLEMGADDYLPKPFNPRELVARVRAIQRRGRTFDESGTEAREPGELQVGDLQLCRSSRSVRRADTPLNLTSVEFNLLQILLERAGQVISREDLVSEALGRRLSAYDRSIDVHISALRKKLGPLPDGAERIRTVRGIGYLYSLSGSDA